MNEEGTHTFVQLIALEQCLSGASYPCHAAHAAKDLRASYKVSRTSQSISVGIEVKHQGPASKLAESKPKVWAMRYLNARARHLFHVRTAQGK